jgi:hypothetical protein
MNWHKASRKVVLTVFDHLTLDVCVMCKWWKQLSSERLLTGARWPGITASANLQISWGRIENQLQ